MNGTEVVSHMVIPTSALLVLGGALFLVGMLGMVIRRNIIIMLMSLELMLNGVNLTFVTFSKQLLDLQGHLSVFFIMVVAAVESAIGLGLLILLFRHTRSIDTKSIQNMKG